MEDDLRGTGTPSDELPRLLALAVHELRTPVTVAAGYVRMLLRDPESLTDVQRRMVEDIERSCGRVAALVSELGELGRLESRDLRFTRVRFDLAALVKELAPRAAANGVSVVVRGATGLPVTGDRLRLTTTLSALLSAAVRERTAPNVVVVACQAIAGWAVVALGDEGMMEELTGHAAATPPSFDDSRGGLGMALPIARRIIDLHGGAIWSVRATPGGSGMALRLPLTRS